MMNELTLSQLEQALDYESVLKQISRFASFLPAKEAIETAMPMDNPAAVRQLLALAEEGRLFAQNGLSASWGSLEDISESITAAEKMITLTGSELLQIGRFLEAVSSAKKLFDKEKYPLLAEMASTMEDLPKLRTEIEKSIDLSGSVRDDATPELRHLHRQLLQDRADLQAKARNFIKSHESDLMDTTTTMIGGRLCVLLKAGSKNKFGGMIHGSSQSGQAFYAEPAALVAINNEIQSSAARIEEEKMRILKDLSRMVKSGAATLSGNTETFLEIDMALAKGQWAYAKDGSIPLMQSTRPVLLLEEARHPLLDEKKAVANTYKLEEGQQALMISGPNMGGKTVSLKTIGLFIAMAHAGFPIGAHRGVLPWFKSIFLDVGDHQSIQENLSTFSAHVSRLAKILDQADDHSFVLLDEMGSGTDPMEGSALAQAVLEKLLDQKAYIMTSTHFDSIKAYGKSDPRILVSSMEIDPETLTPTYKYIPGISGSSFAFAIAKSLNMDAGVLERARELQVQNESQVQKQLKHLEELQQQARLKQERFDKMIAQAHQIQKEAFEKKEAVEKQKKRLDDQYQNQLDSMLNEKEKEAEAILKELRHSQGVMHEQIARKAKLNALRPEEKETGPLEKKDWKAGDYVRIEALNNHGEILEVKKKKAVVLVNGKKINVSTDQLTSMKRPQIKKQSAQRTPKSFAPFPMELNLIGMRVEEAMNALDRYLDQAVVHRLKNVRIIHGMGTGALRKAVWDDLKKRNSVKNYTSAGPSDGGLGATLVELY